MARSRAKRLIPRDLPSAISCSLSSPCPFRPLYVSFLNEGLLVPRMETHFSSGTRVIRRLRSRAFRFSRPPTRFSSASSLSRSSRFQPSTHVRTIRALRVEAYGTTQKTREQKARASGTGCKKTRGSERDDLLGRYA
jgi:hypothetical protein